MAVKNSLVARQGGAVRKVEYESNGVSVSLDGDTVKNYLVSGNKHLVSDQDIVLFMELCRAQHLNPFIRDAYLVKYTEDEPATIITGHNVFKKRADRHPQYNGHKYGVVVLDPETKRTTEREGCIVIPGEQILGGWARVYRKDRDVPFYISLNFNERAQRKKGGELNSTWSKQPGYMIAKCALTAALKEAFSEELGGLYAEEEIQDDVPEIVPVESDVVGTEPKAEESLEDMFG